MRPCAIHHSGLRLAVWVLAVGLGAGLAPLVDRARSAPPVRDEAERGDRDELSAPCPYQTGVDRDELDERRLARPRPPGPGSGSPPPHPLLVALDEDRDGSISPEEMDRASATLKTLDRDRDGMLSPEELRPAEPMPGGPPRPPGPPPDEPGRRGGRPGGSEGRGPVGQWPPPPLVLEQLDADGDGDLSADELKSAASTLLRLDRDHDGNLTRDEILPPRGPRPPGPPGGHRGPPDGPP